MGALKWPLQCLWLVVAESDGRAGQLHVNEAWMHLHKGIVMPSTSSFINELTRFQALSPCCLVKEHSLKV